MITKNKIRFAYKKLICRGCGCILFILATYFVAGCAKKKVEHEIPHRPVKIALAVQKNVPLYIESFGNLASPDSVDVKSQVTGKIQEVHFQEGNEVKKGDLLFTIDQREFKATLDKSEAALAGDQVDLKLKRETLERNKQLIGKKLISQQDYDTYETDVAAAAAQVKLDQANVELAKIDLDYCSITSPIDGRTGKRLEDAGNVVTSGMNAPTLVNIKTIDPLYIDFTIPERDLPRVRDNMAKGTLKVSITAAGDEGGPYQGELKLIDNTVDNTTGTVALRGTVPNKERKLWPGQYVTLKLIVEMAENAVLVPGEAVQLGQKGKYLYVVTDDNKADLRDNITVGQAEDDDLIIEKGVKAGEKVVTYGQLGLSTGDKVQIITGKEQEKGTPTTTGIPEKKASK